MVVHKASKMIVTGGMAPPSKSIALQLLQHGGYIHSIGRGLYSLLPNGQRSVDRLVRIIEKELNGIGGQKVSFPIIGPKELWDKTGRWQSMGPELMTFKDRLNNELCLQPTAEEMCTQLLAQMLPFNKSAFPLMLYQTTEKFRDEMNPRFGLLRGRQFLMNDMYSFDLNEQKSHETYELVSQAYDTILREKLGLNVYKVRADSGIHGGNLSHEYHLPNPLNEDAIHYCSKCNNGGKIGETQPCSIHNSNDLTTVEIAHTFHLGNKYSAALGYTNRSSTPLEMCCFGIGVTRLIHAAVEVLSPSIKATRLPSGIAPYDLAIVVKEKKLFENPFVGSVISSLKLIFDDVLIDDRWDSTIGKRMNNLNLVGIPRYVVFGKSTERTIDDIDPLMELWTAEPFKEKLKFQGDMNHNGIMEFLKDVKM